MNPAELSTVLAREEKVIFDLFQRDTPFGEPDYQGRIVADDLTAEEKDILIKNFVSSRTPEQLEFYSAFLSALTEAFLNPKNKGQSTYVERDLRSQGLSEIGIFPTRVRISSAHILGKPYSPAEYAQVIGANRINHHSNPRAYPRLSKIQTSERGYVGRGRTPKSFRSNSFITNG